MGVLFHILQSQVSNFSHLLWLSMEGLEPKLVYSKQAHSFYGHEFKTYPLHMASSLPRHNSSLNMIVAVVVVNFLNLLPKNLSEPETKLV